eukprot:5277182-Ditylum_brightwellii.AAC.1
MAVVDKASYVKSHNNEETWTDNKTFPSNEKFTEAFKMHQDMSNMGQVTMVMYLSLVHQTVWKDVKFLGTVLNHAKKNNIYIL